MSSRIKVLHYLNNVDFGGTVKTCLLFAKHLDVGQFEVWFGWKDGMEASLDPASSGRFEEFKKICRGRTVAISEGHFQIGMDAVNPDILHIYRSGYKEYPQPGEDFQPEKCKVVETNVFGFLDPYSPIDKTLFMSEWLMQMTMQQQKHPFSPRRFDFVNNPVCMPERLRMPNLLAPANTDILYLGRCGRPDNGIYDSISVKAAKIAQDAGHRIEFLLMAPPQAMIDDLEKYGINYHTFGPTSDDTLLSRFYDTVDIYCHARADGETFGVNIAEAMIHGKPVITHQAVPKVPGMGVFQSQMTLVDHGRTGFVVNPYDPQEYAKYLMLLIDNPKLREEMGINGSTKALKEYAVSSVIRKLEKIYKELVNG